MKKRSGDPFMSAPDYGRSLRGLLLDVLGLRRIDLIDPTAQPFPDAAATATCPSDTAFTGIWRGLAASARGITSLSMPFSKSAVALSISRPLGNVSVRLPLLRRSSR